MLAVRRFRFQSAHQKSAQYVLESGSVGIRVTAVLGHPIGDIRAGGLEFFVQLPAL